MIPTGNPDQLDDINFPQISFISYTDPAGLNSVFLNQDVSEIGLSDTVFGNTTTLLPSSPKNIQTPENSTRPNYENTSTPRKSISVQKISTASVLSIDGGLSVCRICHSSEQSCPFSNGEPLISPCHCRGSTGLYHRTCLEKWLSTVNKDKCEICKFQYRVEHEPKPLFEFLRDPGSKSIQRHIISDAICWLVLTPTALIGAWLCISGALDRMHMDESKMDMFDRIQVPTLIGLASFLIITYLVWSTVCLRYHIKIWNRWRLHNYRIRVLDADETKKTRLKSNPIQSPSHHHNNSNEGFQLQVNFTPMQHGLPHSANAVVTVGPSSPTVVASVGTQYSTPWSHRLSTRSAQQISPYIYSITAAGPAPLATLPEFAL